MFPARFFSTSQGCSRPFPKNSTSPPTQFSCLKTQQRAAASSSAAKTSRPKMTECNSFIFRAHDSSSSGSSQLAKKKTAMAENMMVSMMKSTSRSFSSAKSIGSRYYATNSAVPLQRLSESFADGTSANYVESLYESWKQDPKSVHSSWATYFGAVEKGAAPGSAFQPPPTIRSSSSSAPAFDSFYNKIPFPVSAAPTSFPLSYGATASAASHDVTDSMNVLLLVRAYQGKKKKKLERKREKERSSSIHSSSLAKFKTRARAK